MTTTINTATKATDANYISCKYCGDVLKADTVEKLKALGNVCDNCRMWASKANLKFEDNVIIDGNHYIYRPDCQNSGNKFGGAQFAIKFDTGRIVITKNLQQGESVPKHLTHICPNNAKFISIGIAKAALMSTIPQKATTRYIKLAGIKTNGHWANRNQASEVVRFSDTSGKISVTKLSTGNVQIVTTKGTYNLVPHKIANLWTGNCNGVVVHFNKQKVAAKVTFWS